MSGSGSPAPERRGGWLVQRIVGALLLVATPVVWVAGTFMMSFGRADNAYGYKVAEQMAFSAVALALPTSAAILVTSHGGWRRVVVAGSILLVTVGALVIAIEADPYARTPWGPAAAWWSAR